MTRRDGEQGAIPPRNGRFLKKDGYWYYSTREGVDIGPFDSMADAEKGVDEFVGYIHASDPDVNAVPVNIRRQSRS